MHLAYMELRLGITKFFREFPEATVSRKMTEDDMTPLMFFLIAPKGHQCLIEA
jgi:cytochrome P450